MEWVGRRREGERRARGWGKEVGGERLAKEAMEGVVGSKKEGQGGAEQERERERETEMESELAG